MRCEPYACQDLRRMAARAEAVRMRHGIGDGRSSAPRQTRLLPCAASYAATVSGRRMASELSIGGRGGRAAAGTGGGSSSSFYRRIAVILTTLRTSDTGGEAFLNVHEGLASFGYSVAVPGIEAAEQIEDASVAVTLNVMRQFLGQTWRPIRVTFARKPPRDRRRFAQFFGAPLHFEAPRTCLEFDAAKLDLPAGSEDSAYREILAPLLEQAVRASTPDSLTAVRSIIRTEVAAGGLSRDHVCQTLKLTARTLSNRLEAHGVTYSKLADEARFEAARDLLLRGRTISDVASLLGLAEQSAFTRAFKTWAGMPPARDRASLHRQAF